MDAKARWTLGAVLGVIPASGALLWLSLQEPSGPSRRLPNGSTLTLLGMTYGQRHHWNGESWGRQITRWWEQANLPLSGALRGRRSSRDLFLEVSGDLATTTDQPVLWLRGRDRNGSLYASGPLSATTIDAHGCRMRTRQRDPVTGGVGLGRVYVPALVTSLPLEVFPRRDARFRLRPSKVDGPSADFEIVNPVRPASPSWQAPTCPVTARTGDLRVVLERLRHSTDQEGLLQCTPVLSVFEQGRRSQNWEVERVTVRDATGNALISEDDDEDWRREATFAALCRRESAWKVQMRLVRRDPDRATADATWRLRVPSIPRRDHYQPLNTRLQRRDFSLTGVGVAGGGKVQYPGGITWGNLPSIMLRGSGSDDVLQLSLLQIIDDRDRAYDPSLPPLELRLTESPERTLLLPALPTGTPLTLTLAVHRSGTVEFLVKP